MNVLFLVSMSDKARLGLRLSYFSQKSWFLIGQLKLIQISDWLMLTRSMQARSADSMFTILSETDWLELRGAWQTCDWSIDLHNDIWLVENDWLAGVYQLVTRQNISYLPSKAWKFVDINTYKNMSISICTNTAISKEIATINNIFSTFSS